MEKIRIISLLIPRWKLISLSILLSLSGIVAQLFSPLIMKTLIDDGIPQKDTRIIVLSILGMVLIPVISTGIASMAKSVQIRIGGDINDSLRRQIFQKTISFSPKTVNRLKTGDLVGRVNFSCGEVGDLFIRHELLPALPSVFVVFTILIIMAHLNLLLAAISLIIIPAVYLSTRLVGKKMEESSEEYIQSLNEGRSYFTEVFQGIKTIQLFGRKDFECKRVRPS